MLSFNASQQNVAVFCLDYDKCAHYIFCDKKGKYTGEIDSDNPILAKIREVANDPTVSEIIITVGSSRQDLETDQLGIETLPQGGCFINLLMLTFYLQNQNLPCKFRFSSILNADVNNNKPIGTAFKDTTLDWMWDEYKPTIILTQTHYFAEQYNNTPIDFYFIDDRASPNKKRKNPYNFENDIAGKLSKLFHETPYMLPHNVVFHPYRYISKSTGKGKSKIRKDEIALQKPGVTQGKGPILPQQVWRGLVTSIMDLYEESNEKPDLLKNFKLKVQLLEKYNRLLMPYADKELPNEVALKLSTDAKTFSWPEALWKNRQNNPFKETIETIEKHIKELKSWNNPLGGLGKQKKSEAL